MFNNLALSYALDGKPDKSEALLRKAVDSGHEDKRVRQNLALVLGLQGKFDEARKVASLDMSDHEAKSNMAYLRNMLSQPSQFAAASAGASDGASGDDWQPFGAADAKGASKSAAAMAPPKMQVVKAAEEIKAPSVAKPAKAAQAPASPPRPSKVAGTPTLITPANAAPVPGGVAALLRTDTD